MRTIARIVGAVFVALGLFWAGRESSHGVAAFWEHWWCPIPLALALLGLVGVVVTMRSSRTS
jgi:hypothetical protein